MKRLLQIIFVTIMCFSLFSCFTVKADESKLTLENIKVGEKSTAVGVNKLKLVNTDVTNDMFFNKVGDYITYNVVIKNTSDKDFIIKEINDDNENEYIKYDYLNYQDKVVAAGSEATVNVKATYSKKSSNKVISASAVNFNVLYESYSGNHNANTLDIIIIYISLFMLSVLGFILTFTFNKKHMATYLIIVLGIGVLLPYGVRAKSGVITFKINNNITENSVSFLKTGREIDLKLVTISSSENLHWVNKKNTDEYSLMTAGYDSSVIDSFYGEDYWSYQYYSSYNIDYFVVNATEEQYDLVKNTLNDSNIISVDDSLIPTYYWYDNGVFYFYTLADTIMLNEDSSYLFGYLNGMSSIDLSKFNTSNVIKMNSMFYQCNKVEQLDLSNFDTSKVVNMKEMFNECEKLKNLNLESWNFSFVTNMDSMFYNCNSIETIKFGNINTSNVTDMSAMFMDCESLSSLNLSNFDTSKVTDMFGMFARCSSLTSLNLSSFDTSKVKDMSFMFQLCKNLTRLDLSNFDTSSVTNMAAMFNASGKLNYLDVSSFDTSNVTDMSSMFAIYLFDDENYEYIPGLLTTLDLSNFDTHNVTDMNRMFWNSGFVNLDLSGFDTSNVENMSGMFENCNVLESLDISSFNTLNVVDMSNMFVDCYKLSSLDVSSFDTSNVENMNMMFGYCEELTSLNVSGFNVSNAYDLGNMFIGCKKVESLDLSGFTNDVGCDIYEMFVGCELLKTIYVSNETNIFNNYNDDLFWLCYSLVGGSGTTYDENNISTDFAIIDGGPSAPGYFTLKA